MARLNILALNAGSSSLKASMFELASQGADGEAPSGLRWETEFALGRPLEQILAGLWSGTRATLASLAEIDVVGHRVVHGGAKLLESKRITPVVVAEIARVAEFASAHNAAALALIDEVSALFGQGIAQVAVFDTTFHQTMAPTAFTYPGPFAWLQQGIRRYGFHGISHEYVSHRAERLLARAREGLRVVSWHLGSGCSLAAVHRGRDQRITATRNQRWSTIGWRHGLHHRWRKTPTD